MIGIFKGMEKNQSILKGLFFAIAMMPVVFMGTLIVNYSVNTPFWDQWVVARILIQTFQGNLTVADLLSQHNESRYLFPRLIFIGLAYLTKWNIKYEIFMMFLICCLVSFNIYQINRFTIREKNIVKNLGLLILANILIFAPIQYENLLWGIQLIVFMPIACITTALLVAYSNLKLPVKFLSLIALCTISTFSYANGILSWVLIFPALALSKTWKWTDFIRYKWLLGGWLAAFTTNAIVYFYNYNKPSQTPSFLYAIAHPQQAFTYFFSFLGMPFGWGMISSGSIAKVIAFNTLIGATFFGLFLGAWIYFLKYIKDSALTYRMFAWLTIGSYTIISALITTLGRVGFGVEQSFAPRYTTFSLYLPVALLHLVVIIVDDAFKKGHLPKIRKAINIVALLGIVLLIYFHVLTSYHVVKYSMSSWKLDRLQGKACLLFINVVEEEACLNTRVFPYKEFYPFKVNHLRAKTKKLNQLGFLQPGLVKSSRIQELEGTGKVTADNYGYGWFDNLAKTSDKVYAASGWARLPERSEPSDAVVLTYEKAEGEDIVFAISDTRIARPDVVKATQKSDYLMSGWQKSFDASKLPKGALKIKAWAFDTNTGKAFKINGDSVISNP